MINSSASSTLMYPLGTPGIASARGDRIVQKICPLMPINRRQVWNELPVNGLHDESWRRRKYILNTSNYSH